MKYGRTFNFSAGPAMMPEPVLEEIRDEMMNYRGSGMCVMEMSHRSKVFQQIIDEAEADLRNPEIGPLIERYLAGNESMCTEDKIRLYRLVETLSGGTAVVESMHGAGSPQAQRIMIARQGNIQGKKQLAKDIAGIVD